VAEAARGGAEVDHARLHTCCQTSRIAARRSA
jgi:hypothetical protein